jgi:hypothetical protein
MSLASLHRVTFRYSAEYLKADTAFPFEVEISGLLHREPQTHDQPATVEFDILDIDFVTSSLPDDLIHEAMNWLVETKAKELISLAQAVSVG